MIMSANGEKDIELPFLSKSDKFIHEPARLLIISCLYVVKEGDFLFLKNQTALTWGNLSSHLSKLEEKKYVLIKKEFSGKKSHTMVKLTDEGIVAFEKYREKMKQFIGREKYK